MDQVQSGDRVKFFMHPDGSVVLLPKRPASVLRGIVKPIILRLLLRFFLHHLGISKRPLAANLGVCL